jgi:hypothetical protein
MRREDYRRNEGREDKKSEEEEEEERKERWKMEDDIPLYNVCI